MKNSHNAYDNLIKQYAHFKEPNLFGRYITNTHLKDPLQKIQEHFPVDEIGKSTLGNSIYEITIGNGDCKILSWSQMHGNESTTTKAILDVVNAFIQFPENELIKFLKQNICLKIIPILNPDGAVQYTRENSNNIDLNRDALGLREIESKLLRSRFDQFDPDFCFNLHDQRSIFGAGPDAHPARISFLTPSVNNEREIVPSREISMKVIVSMAQDLETMIPNQIGRYDDSYNPNCTGDTFQGIGTPTILFEAGHFEQDYTREKAREFVTKAILSGLSSIATSNYIQQNPTDYFKIPENEKTYYDVILRNAKVDSTIVDVAIQFKESIKDNKVEFIPVIEKIAPVLKFYAHREIHCEREQVCQLNYEKLCENVIVDKVLKNNEVLIIKFIES